LFGVHAHLLLLTVDSEQLKAQKQKLLDLLAANPEK
jgi:hypothetical protein